MNLLAAKLYDPASAVSKATSSLLAMTAFDTTNLRLAVTVPAHGMVLFSGGVTITGATTYPVVFMGVMNGATVVVRVTPTDFPGTANLATQAVFAHFEAIATGLTPGAANFDLAYGVEVIVASTNFKYGGPNDTTTNNAWGGAQFEAWDPQPQTANTILLVDASGRVDVGKVAGTAQTARDLGAQLDAAVSSRMATYTQPTGFLAATFPTGTVANTTNITAGTVTTATNLTNAPTAGDFTATMKTSLNAATPASVTGSVASVTGNVGGNVVGSVGSVTARVTANADQLAGQTVTAAAGVTFPTSVASPTNITAGTMTTTTNVTNAPTAGDFTAAMKTSLNAATPASITGAVGSVSGAVGSVTGAVGSVTGAVGSVTGNVGGNVVGSVASVTAGVTVTTNNDKTGYSTTDFTTQLTESYRADGAAPTPAQALCELLAHHGEAAISGTTKTIKKFDHATSAETFTLDSATAPTSITRAT